MNKVLKKIKSNKGETLIESLVSLLIAALSIAMLVSCILACSRINETNRKADEKYNKDLYRAEAAISEEGYEKEAGSVTIDFETTADKTVEVDLYGGEDGSFLTYKYKEGTP